MFDLQTKKYQFECNQCFGLCCFNPPQLSSKEEIKKALKYKVHIICIKLSGEYMCAITKNQKDQCPFLDENNKCSIYDNRFE